MRKSTSGLRLIARQKNEEFAETRQITSVFKMQKALEQLTIQSIQNKSARPVTEIGDL